MPNIQLHRVKTPDLEVLQKLSIDTFVETFAEHNTEKNMQKYISTRMDRESIRREIINLDSVFYLALLDGKTVGYMKMNYRMAQTEMFHYEALELERIYVLKKYFGTGVGRMMMQFAIEVGKQRRSDYLWLGVWEKNERAIQFYLKNNFTKFSEHKFMLGDDEQTDILMKRELDQ